MAKAWGRSNAFIPYPNSVVAHAESGILSGQRLAVKDLFDVCGYPTSAGNAVVLSASGLKEATAPIVRMLLGAGVEFVGKTYTDELAYSLIGKNVHFGAPINPGWPDLIAGGSSSGSAAAVASDLADIGLGTDTSGSIRLPAAANGLYGWRATHGMLSLVGCRPLAPSFDAAGFLAKSASGIGKIMSALGVQTSDSDQVDLVIAEDLLDPCDPDIAESFGRELTSAKQQFKVVRTVLECSLTEAVSAFETVLWREAYLTNEQLFVETPGSIDPSIASRLEQGRRIGARELAEAQAIRDQVRLDLRVALGGTAVLSMPTIPTFPPRIDATEEKLDLFRTRSIAMLCLAGLGGCPQIAAPCCADRGPPASISFLAPPLSDRRALNAAVQFAR